MGKCPTVSIEKTDGCQVYLSRASLEVEIVTSKSSAMNILIPNENDDDFSEQPVPEQFKTLFNPKTRKLVTTATESTQITYTCLDILILLFYTELNFNNDNNLSRYKAFFIELFEISCHYDFYLRTFFFFLNKIFNFFLLKLLHDLFKSDHRLSINRSFNLSTKLFLYKIFIFCSFFIFNSNTIAIILYINKNKKF